MTFHNFKPWYERYILLYLWVKPNRHIMTLRQTRYLVEVIFSFYPGTGLAIWFTYKRFELIKVNDSSHFLQNTLPIS